MKAYLFLMLFLAAAFAATFNISTTPNWDLGTKNNIETHTDYFGVADGVIQLKFGVLFSDNFDSENNGATPADWVKDGSYPPHTFEISNVTDITSPNSMLIGGSSDILNAVHHNVAITGAEPYELYVYFEKTNVRTYINTQNNAGDWSASNQAVALIFEDDGHIKYYDGAWHDTGYTYSTGWHKVKIVHNFTGDQFDAWYDGTQVVDNGNFRNSADSVQSIQLGCDPQSTGATNWRFDDVKVGEFYTTGDWASPTFLLPSQSSQLTSTTLKYAGVSTENYIDKIKWLTNGTVNAEYDTNITSGTERTITESNLTSGSFATVAGNIIIEVYVVGNGSASPTISEISGAYTYPSEGGAETVVHNIMVGGGTAPSQARTQGIVWLWGVALVSLVLGGIIFTKAGSQPAGGE